MLERFLDPTTLASISGLDLVAKTVVDGFVAGLHRSPSFGFSQEFAEYRAYVPGDDLRHVDWNVFARTDRCYLKRFWGETNTQLLVLLDSSSSMAYGSGKVSKLDYGRYLAASLAYLSTQQRDAAGLIVFDEDIRNFVAPSTRQGQLYRLLHAIGETEPSSRKRTEYTKPFDHFQEFIRRRSVAVVISDFNHVTPEDLVKAVAPLRFRGNDVVLFHLLDPMQIKPTFRDPVVLIDMETGGEMEVSPEYVKTEYPAKIAAQIKAFESQSRAAGLDYFFVNTGRPLDEPLREYLGVRQGRM
jgi:uncharacterized protein (DUF58 family)